MATKNFIEELEWRGMIHTIMPGAKEQLEKEMTTAYLGIDPTADSLHIGHLVGVMILKHFQMCGHRPLALIGGATGMIVWIIPRHSSSSMKFFVAIFIVRSFYSTSKSNALRSSATSGFFSVM